MNQKAHSCRARPGSASQLLRVEHPSEPSPGRMDGWMEPASEPLLSQPCFPSGTRTPVESAAVAGGGGFSRLWCVLSVFASRLSLLLRSYSSARARAQTTAGPHWPAPELETGRSQSESAIAACALFPNTEHFVSEEGNAHIHTAVFDSCCCVFHGDSRDACLEYWARRKE